MSDIDEKMLARLQRLEREVERLRVGDKAVAITDHGALSGLSDNDHPQYLLATGKAADSDKLDNIDSTGFVQTSGNQTVAGIKTFSSIPVLPASDPTTANQAVRKSYADALVPSATTLYTATLVGWSGTPTQAMKYVRIGKLMILTIYISGTSNTTTATATLPAGITAMALGYSQYAPMRVMNAGSRPGSWGMAELSSGGSTISFYINQGGSGWASSGTKTIEGTFVFLTA